MNAEQKEITEDEYEDLLNEESVNILGCEYSVGTVLKEVDPVRFGCNYCDYSSENMPWICGECGEEYETEDEANECCQDSEE